MKKLNSLTGVFALLFASMLFITSCGGGGGGSASGSGFGGSADESPDVGDSSDNPVNTGVDTPISSISIDLTGAVGLAIDNSAPTSGTSALDVSSIASSSNLKRVNPDNTLSDAVKSGSVKVQSFMVAANNQIYLLLTSPVDSCILVRVNGDTNETSCVDSTLSQISWANSFGDPIQFDGEGNVYYKGTAGGKTILRKNAGGTTTDLINDYISLSGFLVLNDGSVIIAGNTSATGSSWTRIVTLAGSLQNLLPGVVPSFLTLFPDNNVYIGNAKGFTIARYLTATEEFDSRGWIGSSTDTAYFTCPAGVSCSPGSILRTSDGKVFIENGKLVQYYPAVVKASTTISTVTISKGILTYIVLAGFDSNDNNKLVLYNTDTDIETDLMGSENIEVYHLNYLNSASHQVVMFDGLRFSDNRYVLCQVDLTDNNTLTCSLTGTGKLTDFQLFDSAGTIAGGGMSSTKTYTIGGTVEGLDGTLILQNNGGDSITLTKNGSFTFPIAVNSDYDVTIQSNPQGQLCTVSNGSGTVSGVHVTTVSISCSYAIGGTITGLEGTLVLKNNVGDTFILTASGSFLFPVSIESYQTVTVQSNPEGQFCMISNGRGTVHEISVLVTCFYTADHIITVAGNGSRFFSGDGGPATSASFQNPQWVTFDSSGNLYITDTYSGRIRKVSSTGVITTVAGNGSTGFGGDGGPAVNAQLYSPQGIAFDSFGNLYIADPGNDRIRRVATNGIITTVAGNGTRGFGGDGGQAVNATLCYPRGIAFDSLDNLYIADSCNQRIRKVGTNGIITTVAGNGDGQYGWYAGPLGDGGLAVNAGLAHPNVIIFDSSGNLYAISLNRIRKVNTNGIITTVAGNGSNGVFWGDGGPATSATLGYSEGIAFDSAGNLYISDSSNHRIRKVDANGIITTVAGNGTAGFSGDGGFAKDATLNEPAGIAFDSSDNLFIADYNNQRIRIVFGE